MPPISTSRPTIVITGCSTGLGRALAESALEKGYNVIATARNSDSLRDLADKGAKALKLDVTVAEDVLEKFAKDVVNAFGSVDVLVNNAGYLQGGAMEELSSALMKAQFDANFFGVVNVTNAFLPHFRSRKSGTIVNISSQGALLNLQGGGMYCASKAAVDSVTEVYSKELAPFNIRITAIALGAFRTSVASNNTKGPEREIEGYTAAHDWLIDFQKRGGSELGDSNKAAKRLLEIIELDGPLPPNLPLGEDAVHLVRLKLKKRVVDAEKWESYGMGTNVDGVKYENAAF